MLSKHHLLQKKKRKKEKKRKKGVEKTVRTVDIQLNLYAMCEVIICSTVEIACDLFVLFYCVIKAARGWIDSVGSVFIFWGLQAVTVCVWRIWEINGKMERALLEEQRYDIYDDC